VVDPVTFWVYGNEQFSNAQGVPEDATLNPAFKDQPNPLSSAVARVSVVKVKDPSCDIIL
jgi:hypothetical protein